MHELHEPVAVAPLKMVSCGDQPFGADAVATAHQHLVFQSRLDGIAMSNVHLKASLAKLNLEISIDTGLDD